MFSFCSERSSRTCRLKQPPCKTTRRRNSFFPAAAIIINNTWTDWVNFHVSTFSDLIWYLLDYFRAQMYLFWNVFVVSCSIVKLAENQMPRKKLNRFDTSKEWSIINCNGFSWQTISCNIKNMAFHSVYNLSSKELRQKCKNKKSSAYLITLVVDQTGWIESTDMENNKGLSTLPWGIPLGMTTQFEDIFFLTIRWCRLERKLTIHLFIIMNQCVIRQAWNMPGFVCFAFSTLIHYHAAFMKSCIRKI